MRVVSWCSVLFVTFLSTFRADTNDRELRVTKNKGFLFYRKYVITERPCKCSTTFSCSCCVTVTLLYTKRRRELCSNFVYQRNGLNVDISLDTDSIKTMTTTNYRPFKMCSAIPGSLFSAICVNVTELNQFPRSLTACVRHQIVTKIQEWQIDYTCVSISTELPAATGSTSMMMSRMTSPMGDEMPMTEGTTPTQGPMKPDVPSEMPDVPPGMPPDMRPEMPPNSLMGVEPVPSTEEPEAEISEKLESLTAIVGARKRRGTRLKLRKSSIVNTKGHAGPMTEKLKSPIQTVNDSVPNGLKLPLEAGNLPPKNLAVADEPFDEVPTVPDQTGRYDFHNRTEHFPNRIPPIFATTINSENSTIKNDAYYKIMGKNLAYKILSTNGTNRIIFPD